MGNIYLPDRPLKFLKIHRSSELTIQDENVEVLHNFREYCRLQSTRMVVKQLLYLSFGLCSCQILVITVLFIVMDLV